MPQIDALKEIRKLEKTCNEQGVHFTSGKRFTFKGVILGEVVLDQEVNLRIIDLLGNLRQWDIRNIYSDMTVFMAWVELNPEIYLESIRSEKKRVIDEERIRKKQRRAQLAERKAQERKNILLKEVRRMLRTSPLEAHDFVASSTDRVLVDYESLKLEWVAEIDGKEGALSRLPEEQVLAIADLSRNVLLEDRAGSGKTTVIKHKVDFLMRHVGLVSDDFMVLAFNKTAATEIKKSLQTEFNHLTFQNARTFHSLAYQLVLPTQELLFDIGTGSDAKQSQLVESLLKDELNPAVKEEIYNFFRSEMSEIESLGSLLNKEDYYELRRNSAQDTLKGESVKSRGEKWIADYLFEHGIRYAYERPWYRDPSGKGGNYYPDFSLLVEGTSPNVVIEHWGIDEHDDSQTVPEHWGQTWQDYQRDMMLKRQYWEKWNRRNPNNPVSFLETSVVDTAMF